MGTKRMLLAKSTFKHTKIPHSFQSRSIGVILNQSNCMCVPQSKAGDLEIIRASHAPKMAQSALASKQWPLAATTYAATSMKFCAGFLSFFAARLWKYGSIGGHYPEIETDSTWKEDFTHKNDFDVHLWRRLRQRGLSGISFRVLAFCFPLPPYAYFSGTPECDCLFPNASSLLTIKHQASSPYHVTDGEWVCAANGAEKQQAFDLNRFRNVFACRDPVACDWIFWSLWNVGGLLVKWFTYEFCAGEHRNAWNSRFVSFAIEWFVLELP